VIAADAVGAILLASVTLYAVLGGADFGGGLWDLLAGGDRRGAAPRALIEESITPVWEANHVWLVFDLVIFWTAFPHAFAAVMTAAALPIWLAAAGIVLRGAGFAFRKEVDRLSLQRAFGAVFAFSSLLTPFFMGTVIGGIAAGKIPGNASHASLTAWTGPTSILIGFLFTGACGYLAAVYLVGEAARRGDQPMAAYFTRRAQAAGVVAGALSLGTLLELRSSDLALLHRLTGRALPLVIIAGLTGLAVLGLLEAGRRRGAAAPAAGGAAGAVPAPAAAVGVGVGAVPVRADRGAGAIRALAALGVAAVVWGWGIAQYPALLPGTGVTLTNAGAPHATLVAVVVLFVAVVVLIGPSFALLFALQSRQVLNGGEAGLALATRPGSSLPALTPGRSAARPPAARSRAAVLGLVAFGALVRALARRRNR
jgi:cytochrome d ubiquinol oxidase subunit II